MYRNFRVQFSFTPDESGAEEYIFPYVQNLSDPKEGMKSVTISGNRGDGSLCIPGGKKSQEIVIKGKLVDEEGYQDLTIKINELKSKVSTDAGIFKVKHWNPDSSGGGDWETDEEYIVRRINEIEFGESMRTSVIDYTVSFLVLQY